MNKMMALVGEGKIDFVLGQVAALKGDDGQIATAIVKTNSGAYYSQFQQSKYKTPHRSPFNISLVKDLQVTDFVLEAKVLSTGKDKNELLLRAQFQLLL